MAVVTNIRIPERIPNIKVHSTRILGLRQPPGHELHVRGQGDRRLLRGPGDLVPDVPRVHRGPAGGAHGHQVPVPQWHRL